jgi:prepilin-type N-terminal cleavage/methylation domain-containing protein
MRPRGVTLLETVIALAITAVVLSALYGAVMRAAAGRQRATARADRLAAARTLMLRLAREIEAGLPPEDAAGPERFVVSPPSEMGPPWSAIRFAGGGPETRLINYRVEAGTLVRREASRFAPSDALEPAGIPLVEGVTAFRVRCFDGAVWRTAWTADRLPRAVEITMGTDDGLELSTTVALPLAQRS